LTTKVARKRLDPARRSELILDVALKLFAEQHYNAVSVRDIAEACEINAGLIYYYFESKDQLLRRVLGHALGQLHAGYDIGRRHDLNPAQELSAWLNMHVPIAPMITRMVKIMADYSASTIRDVTTDEMITDFYAREQKFLEDCLQRGVESKVFWPVDVSKIARFISLQLDGIFYASTSRGDNRIAQDISNLCDVFESLSGYHGRG
jgi:TetR/AcrR family transcriptional regulator, cholesterol catabolism regulator